MKLITELNYDVGSKLDEDKNGNKFWYVEGIFAQAEQLNNNGRVYPVGILERECEKFKNEQIITGRAVGELNHPSSPTVDYNNVSHKIEKLEKVGNNFEGRAIISPKGKGEIIQGLLEIGVTIAMSSRALGTTKNINGFEVIQDNLNLRTFDIVSDPGAPEAFMNGIMEGVEYKFMDDQIVAEKIDNIVQEVHKTNSKEIQEALINGFTEINSIVGKLK